jgi:cytochrome b561
MPGIKTGQWRCTALPAIVFGGSGDPLPADFAAYPSWIAHIALAVLLVGLIGLHLLAALCHRLVRKDRLLQRMLLGRRGLSNPAVAAEEVLDIYP